MVYLQSCGVEYISYKWWEVSVVDGVLNKCKDSIFHRSKMIFYEGLHYCIFVNTRNLSFLLT